MVLIWSKKGGKYIYRHFIVFLFFLLFHSFTPNGNTTIHTYKNIFRKRDIQLDVTFAKYSTPAYLVAQSCPTRCDPLDCSQGFFRQKYCSRLSSPPPRDLPDPGIKSKFFVSAVLHTNSLPAEPLGKPKIFYMKKHIPKLSMEDSRSLPDKSQGLLHYFPDLCYTFSGFLAGPG